MNLSEKIGAYKRKYYLNRLVKGSIFALSVLLISFFLFSLLEYFGNFGTPVRATMFYSFLLTMCISLWVWVLAPLMNMLISKRQFSDTEAAKQIGSFFPQVNDKLLNTLQLMQAQGSSDLLQASVAQKSAELSGYQFTEAIDLSDNRRYLKYLLIPFIVVVGVFIYRKDFFAKSATRIVYYNQQFEPEAPFRFLIQEQNLSAFKNEDFELKLSLEGAQIPAEVYIITEEGRRLKMSDAGTASFAYTFKKIQRGVFFKFEAAGFVSKQYELEVVARPSLQGFDLQIDYPSYLGKKDEYISNTGNVMVPEGSSITWNFRTQDAGMLQILFQSDGQAIKASEKGNGTFEASRRFTQPDGYEVQLQNERSQNKEKISYFINVVKDQHPSISLRQHQDSVLYSYLLLGGNIGDDYGITSLQIKYQIVNEGQTSNPNGYIAKNLPFNADIINQSYFHRIELDSFRLKEGQRLEYFLEVWDNDGVNGRKSAKTGVFTMKLPSAQEMKEEVAQDTKQTEKEIDDVLKKAKDLNKELKEVQDRLKGKEQLDWQDKKAMQNLIQKQEELTKKIEEMKEQNALLQEKMQKFNEISPQLAEKAQQLQELMEQLLDEETKKLFEELNQLMEENVIDQELLEKLDKIDFKEQNLEKELERSMELFKKLKADMKAEKLGKDMKQLSEKQEELAKETEKAGDEQLEQKAKEQEQLNQEFENLQKDFKELEKMNNELDKPKDLEDVQEEMKDIEKELEEAEQKLNEAEQHEEQSKQEQGAQKQEQKKQQSQKQKEGNQKQKKASEKMKKLSDQLSEMQQSAEMESMEEDYGDLRQILDNLVKLSFDQEQLMKEFRAIRRIDPKFLEINQKQLKLKADAKVIEDSLIALSKRVFQIQSFVTRELASMNEHIDDAIEIIRKRPGDVTSAASSKQQFAMTSMNNLALMLSDILDQMQMQMSSGMGGKQMKEKKGKMPNMSELQDQLNKQIESLKKGGKSGRQMSEELAKLAMQQEMIRRAIQGAKKQGAQMGGSSGGNQSGQKLGPDGKPMNPDGQKPGDGKGEQQGDGVPLEKLMEETEKDLVNKRITAQTLERQKQIMTRLLESEKAMRERELDQQRKAETAKSQRWRESPNAFSEYLKNKEKQIELLKTIPPALSPYYKQEVNEYFKKMGGQ